MRILIAEDNAEIAHLIQMFLEKEDYEVIWKEDGQAALDYLLCQEVALCIFDIMMPRLDGFTLIQKVRKFSNVPILVLTAKNMEQDKILGLDLGADDYLAKPFGMMEMVSRVKAVLRRVSHAAPSQVLTHKNITLNESSHQVFVDGNQIELTIKEYLLLRLFLKNPGVAFTRENLLSSVWESEYQGETRTVDVHIASLRTKLGSAGECIKTVRGVGYRMEDAK